MEHSKTVGFEVRTLSNLIRRYIDNSPTKKKMSNITGIHGWVIGFLYSHGDEDVFQRDVEEEFEIRRSTATAILQLMEKNQLITKEPVTYDARLKKLVLTQKAIEMHQKVVTEINHLEHKMTQGITGEEMDAFFKTIEKIKKNIE